MAILIEHLAGKWPFWLSPRQIIVLPISEKANEYCEKVYLYMHHQGFNASMDRSQGQVNKKVRNAQLAQWNYILVCGEDEMAAGTADVRTRDNQRHGKKRIDVIAAELKALECEKSDFHNRFYANMWKASDYNLETVGEAVVQEELKGNTSAPKTATV
jgi:threonyl-tRNA synthetase